MNKIALILSIGLFDILPAKSQNILVPGHQWIYEYNVYEPGIGLYSQSIESISVGADTLINGVTYTRLIATKIPPCSMFDTIEYVREEGSRLYRLSQNHQHEYLVIDFEETIGYELHFEDIYPEGQIDTAYAIVDSFGLEYIYDGTPVETQYLHIVNNQSFGDETVYKVFRDLGFIQYGILFPNLGSGLCDFYIGIALRCVISGTDTLHFTEFDCHESSLINGTTQPEKESVNLFPNPTSDFIFVPVGYTFLDIVGITGVMHKASQTDTQVNISHLPPGLYVVRGISSEKQTFFVEYILKQW